jgi:biopolymer transport protein ExbD
MGKVKMSKKATSIDMTAMCDVAFLLLTFFILTATAKQPEPLPVDTPSSTVQTKLPDTDLAMITIGNKGTVFMGIKGTDVRKRTLEIISEKTGIAFSAEEIEKFGLLDEFGVKVTELRGLLKLKSAERNQAGLQTGIPHDSLDNQLKDWISAARNANAELHQKQLDFAIKGDAKETYPDVKKVMDILQKEKVNKFFLVTGLRSKDF